MPVSLLGTFAVFPLLGFSVNTLSLFGMVLAIGIVVDDAIVVVEAVMHHIEQGISPREATIQAMKEVSGPIVGIALILVAVFIPVAFLGGLVGQLYQQFALTIAISVMISAFNALSLSPALSAVAAQAALAGQGLLGKFFGGFNRAFDAPPTVICGWRGNAGPQSAAEHVPSWLWLPPGRAASRRSFREVLSRMKTRAS